jgi:hypothetical protein
MPNPLVIGFAALSLLASPTAARTSSAPPPDSVTVQIATVIGTGCPSGTAAIDLDPSGVSYFTVTYSAFTAKVGGGAPPVLSRRNCQLGTVVHVPQGFTFAIATTNYRGYADLAAGAVGHEKANYYFQGMSTGQQITHDVPGPTATNWQATDTVPVASYEWRPCGSQRHFNINMELNVGLGTSSPRVQSWMNMDSTDVDFSTVYHFAWKTCP